MEGFRPLVVVWTYWQEVVNFESNAELLDPVYIEVAGEVCP